MKTPSLSLQDNDRIYLDYNATTPPLRELQEHMAKWLSLWGNPSSIHQSGRGPKNAIREARANLAKVLNCSPIEIVFTSGGSESNNSILKGFFASNRDESRNEYISSTVEHPSVMKALEQMETQGAIVHRIAVNRDGELDLKSFEKVLSKKTALVSIMAANNETGAIFPIQKLAAMSHAVGARFHTDAVQALGKIQVDLKGWDVDYASFASHKVQSIKGGGILFTKSGQRLSSLIAGGGQERGRRAGTENTLAISAFGFIAKKIESFIEIQNEKICGLRNFMETKILSEIERVSVTGAQNKRLPNTSSLLIDGVDGESLLMSLDLEGISVSTGAACSSGNPEPSPVLIAMGLSRQEAQKSLRISLGVDTTEEEIENFILKLKKIVIRLRSIQDKESSHVV